jgi:hypothetical protein
MRFQSLTILALATSAFAVNPWVERLQHKAEEMNLKVRARVEQRQAASQTAAPSSTPAATGLTVQTTAAANAGEAADQISSLMYASITEEAHIHLLTHS